jgi:hypothetical protein
MDDKEVDQAPRNMLKRLIKEAAKPKACASRPASRPNSS